MRKMRNSQEKSFKVEMVANFEWTTSFDCFIVGRARKDNVLTNQRFP